MNEDWESSIRLAADNFPSNVALQLPRLTNILASAHHDRAFAGAFGVAGST